MYDQRKYIIYSTHTPIKDKVLTNEQLTANLSIYC